MLDGRTQGRAGGIRLDIQQCESLKVWPVVIPVTETSGLLPPTLSMRVVLRLPAPKVLGVVFGVPLPVSVMPFEMESPLVQVQVPAGIIIVSPRLQYGLAR